MQLYQCNYLSLMVTAYSQLTGRTIEQSLQELGSLRVDPAEIQIKNRKEKEILQDLLKDREGVLRWVEGR